VLKNQIFIDDFVRPLADMGQEAKKICKLSIPSRSIGRSVAESPDCLVFTLNLFTILHPAV